MKILGENKIENLQIVQMIFSFQINTKWRHKYYYNVNVTVQWNKQIINLSIICVARFHVFKAWLISDKNFFAKYYLRSRGGEGVNWPPWSPCGRQCYHIRLQNIPSTAVHYFSSVYIALHCLLLSNLWIRRQTMLSSRHLSAIRQAAVDC